MRSSRFVHLPASPENGDIIGRCAKPMYTRAAHLRLDPPPSSGLPVGSPAAGIAAHFPPRLISSAVIAIPWSTIANTALMNSPT